MPAISAPETVLVTGANGYIAIQVVKSLLEQGFNVRGTVRSADKGEYVKKMFAKYGDRLELVVLKDFQKHGAFDDVVKGVAAIQHVGAPLPQAVKDVNEIVGPTVDGALSLLESARKAGTVKRVVIESTFYAVMEPKEGPYVYTEVDWNETVVKALEENGLNTPSAQIYAASKVLVEKAVFGYVEKNRDAINFDVVTILPTYVFGPPIQEVETIDAVGFGSTETMWNGFTNNGKSAEWVNPESYVDVRDVAEMHVLSIIKEGAGNKRFLAVAGTFNWQDAYDALNAVQPKLHGVPIGKPGSGKEAVFLQTADNTQAKEVLGLQFRSMEESVVDSWMEFVKRGWIPSA